MYHSLRMWMITLLFIGGGLLALSAFVGKLVSVQTDSMRPTFQAGDALLTQRIRPQQVRVGDIISYKNPIDANSTISHRVVSVSPQGFKTQGDVQKIAGELVPYSALKGRAIGRAPKLGLVIDWLHSIVGRLIVCYIPAFLIIGSEIWQLSRQLYRPVYRLHAVP